MEMEMTLDAIRSEMDELFYGTEDTIYFDDASKIFKIFYTTGNNIGITPDRLIDIL